MRTQITAQALTTFDVDAQGCSVRINVRDEAGQAAALVLPVNCLNQLLMSLPGMIQAALRRSHADPTLRLVHPLAGYAVQRGECDAGGVLQYILTLETAGGFCVSFSAPGQQLGALANEMVDDVCGDEVTPAMAHLHS